MRKRPTEPTIEPTIEEPTATPSLATEKAEAARREVLRLAAAIEAARTALPPEGLTPEDLAHGAGSDAAMAGSDSPAMPLDLVIEAYTIPTRRAYLGGMIEVLTRQLRSATNQWRLAIDEALVDAAIAIEAAIVRHDEAKAATMMAASREASEKVSSLPMGAELTRGWQAPATLEWEAEAQRLRQERTRLRGVRPSLATWELGSDGLGYVVRTARQGLFV